LRGAIVPPAVVDKACLVIGPFRRKAPRVIRRGEVEPFFPERCIGIALERLFGRTKERSDVAL
jgi:hypothetical protein